MELQLHCYLRTQSISILPRMVALHHGLPEGAAKKQAAVRLVKTLPLVQPWLERLQAEGKRDDLADALLQALAFWAWRRNLQALLASNSAV